MSAEAEIWTFPTNPDEFDSDERISLSKLDNKYIAVQDDGSEFEFDSELKRWVPTADDSFVHEYETGYLAPDAAPDYQESSRGGRKRKKDRSNDREVSCAPYAPLQLSISLSLSNQSSPPLLPYSRRCESQKGK